MRDFSYFIETGKVKKKAADPAEAAGLLKRSARRINYFSGSISPENMEFIFEGLYEAVRECLQSFMSIKGFKPYSHEAVIVFALENSVITETEAMEMDRMRKIRNDILYRGSDIDIRAVEEIVPFTRELVSKINMLVDALLEEDSYQ